MTRGDVDKVEANGKLSVHLSNSLLGEHATLEADLVVLAVGMVPTARRRRAHPQAPRRPPPGASTPRARRSAPTRPSWSRSSPTTRATEILQLTYRQGPDLPALKYSFPDSHFICFPYETAAHRHLRAGPSTRRWTRRRPRGRARRCHEGRPVHRDGEARRDRPSAGRRPRLPRLLPAALHPVQALHRGVPVRDPHTEDAKGTPELNHCAAAAAGSAWAPAGADHSASRTTRCRWSRR